MVQLVKSLYKNYTVIILSIKIKTKKTCISILILILIKKYLKKQSLRSFYLLAKY